ncbi:MAG: AbrB/MazE/SpoVT family DNA-binding domain-containing protein [Nitrososphaerales archaeon]
MDEVKVGMTRVSSKGQVIIPWDIRQSMEIKEGSKLIVLSTEDSIILQPIAVASEKFKVAEMMKKVKDLITKVGF